MNINSTLTSTRNAITVNTTQVWTSKAMAQRCGRRCVLSVTGATRLQPSDTKPQSDQENPQSQGRNCRVRGGGGRGGISLFTLCDEIRKGTGRDASSSPSSSSSVCTATPVRSSTPAGVSPPSPRSDRHSGQ